MRSVHARSSHAVEGIEYPAPRLSDGDPLVLVATGASVLLHRDRLADEQVLLRLDEIALAIALPFRAGREYLRRVVARLAAIRHRAALAGHRPQDSEEH